MKGLRLAALAGRRLGQEAPHAFHGDFYFCFEPATPPTGSLGSGSCKSGLASYEGIDYAPDNDASITNAAQDQGLVIILPQKPGGTRDYPTTSRAWSTPIGTWRSNPSNRSRRMLGRPRSPAQPVGAEPCRCT